MRKKSKASRLIGVLIILLGLINGPVILAQQINITGRVTHDQTNEALVGVTVIEKGTSNGTLTDVGGNYSLPISDANSILVFSFVGMETQEAVVGVQRVINISLKESVSILDEVIVTGYQTQRRADLTGSVAVVKMDEVADIPTGNVLTNIQGRVWYECNI